MGKTWAIWAFLFTLAGIIGLGGVAKHQYDWQRETAAYRQQHGQAADGYLRKYEQWRQLTDEQRQENPWGFGEYGGEGALQQLKDGQQTRLKADLEALANGTKNPQMLADVLYGSGWRLQVDEYRKNKEMQQAISTASTVSITAGIIMLCGYLIKRLVNAVTGNRDSKETFFARIFRRKKDQAQIEPDPDQAESEPEQVAQGPDRAEPVAGEQPDENQQWQEPAMAAAITRTARSGGYFQASGTEQTGIDSAALKESLRKQAPKLSGLTGMYGQSSANSQAATLMATEPVNNGLSELTQEVSAIREFAAQQQDRVRQLQDGYDWGIIKRFCIRVIRCIDNLDDRIKRFVEEGQETEYLEDVRDELVFSLESSGVEQFEPEIDSDYRGQEKRAEAVRTREQTDDSDLSGKIAEVMRPGYQYVVNDDDIKIVRSARVKLYQ